MKKLWYNVLSGVEIFDFANAVRLLYHNRGALCRSGRGSGGSMNPSTQQRYNHNRWVHYTIFRHKKHGAILKVRCKPNLLCKVLWKAVNYSFLALHVDECISTRFVWTCHFEWTGTHSVSAKALFRVGRHPLVFQINVLSSGVRIVDRRWKGSFYPHYLTLYVILRRESTHSFGIKHSIRVGRYPLVFKKSPISSGSVPTHFIWTWHFGWVGTHPV